MAGKWEKPGWYPPWTSPWGTPDNPLSKAVGGPEVVVRYKGPFDWTYVYRSVYRWFEQRRFRCSEGRYKETEKKLKTDITGTRVIDEFFTETYTINFEMWFLKRSEVIVAGEPRIIYNGLVNVGIKGGVQMDQAGFFDEKGEKYADSGKPFRQFLGGMFMEARWREIGATHVDTMEYRIQDLQTMIKRALNMSTKENAPWVNTHGTNITNMELPPL